MSHTCEICGEYCDCDMEDRDQPAPDDCTHCDGEIEDHDYFRPDEFEP